MTRVWVKDPHSGGVKIPERIQETVKNRIVSYAEAHYAGKYTRIDVRFNGYFCYIDAYTEPFVPEDYIPNEWSFSVFSFTDDLEIGCQQRPQLIGVGTQVIEELTTRTLEVVKPFVVAVIEHLLLEEFPQPLDQVEVG